MVTLHADKDFDEEIGDPRDRLVDEFLNKGETREPYIICVDCKVFIPISQFDKHKEDYHK